MNLIRLLVLIIRGIFRMQNKYNDSRAASGAKKMRSDKITLEELKEELMIIQARKIIREEQNFYTTGAIEKKLEPLLGKSIFERQYKLDFFRTIDNHHVLIIIKATIVDEYKFDEYYSYIMKLDSQKREVTLYSDAYADARMKFSKATVMTYLFEML